MAAGVLYRRRIFCVRRALTFQTAIHVARDDHRALRFTRVCPLDVALESAQRACSVSVYQRFKRAHGGFRQLVELLESTPAARRERMIEVGRIEDAEYTKRALALMMTFDDILNLPDEELAELVAAAPAKMIGYAIIKFDEEVQRRFLRCAKADQLGAIRDAMDTEQIGLREIGGAQLKVIEAARALERKGYVKVKRIPETPGS